MKLVFDLLVGVVALYFLKEGKRNANFAWIIISIVMIFAPYFAATITQDILITSALGAGLYFFR